MWSRAELKERAKRVLKISYWKAFLVSLVISFAGANGRSPNFNFNLNDTGSSYQGDVDLFSAFNYDGFPLLAMIFGIIFLVVFVVIITLRIFIGYHLEVGGRSYFISATQNNIDMNNLGRGFKKGVYIDIVKAMLWRSFINFLWYLLFIIPGIIKSYSYRMVPYILADNPNIGYKRALELSKQMTDGEKLAMWILDLSFIGWYLLGLCACIIGVVFVLPYQDSTEAELYLVLRQKSLDLGFCTREELLLDNTALIV